MGALAALLDRSVEQIAQGAADARWLDRETMTRVADVWDNNTFPLFWAASASRAGERERRAKAALEWMAALGEQRRRWMVEQAAIAGYDMAALLPPAQPDLPYRDYLGHVRAPVDRLTRQVVDGLVLDYDLAAATVRSLHVERGGTRLTAVLRLAVDRLFTTEEDANAPTAVLEVRLEDVAEAVFDAADTRGVAVDAAPGEVRIAVGAGGVLRAADGSSWVHDGSWHLSRAGRRADAAIPPGTEESGRRRPPPAGKLGADALAAAYLLQFAMLQLRSGRYARRADPVAALDLCRAFAGAGTAVLDAGSRRGAGRREAAFRDLILHWADRGGPALGGWFAETLRKYAGRSDLIEAPDDAARTPPALTGSPAPSGPPAQAVLVMASWSAPYTERAEERASAASLQLALPPGPDEPAEAPWRIRTTGCAAPDAFRLRTEAFQGIGRLSQEGRPTAACSVDLHLGALHVAAAGGWSASLE